MKKIVAILMMLCMLLTATAFAEAAEVNWADVEPAIEAYGLQGDFVTLDEIAVKIWIPASMQAVELTEEDVQQGFIAYFADDEASISVVYVDVEGMTLEDYAAQVAEAGGQEVTTEVINGLPALEYQLPENDCLCVAFTTEAGYILEITMAPLSVEGADIAWGIVGSSIQAA